MYIHHSVDHKKACKEKEIEAHIGFSFFVFIREIITFLYEDKQTIIP